MKGKRTYAMLATILSATLAAGALAGCGAQPQQTEKPAQDAAEEAEPAAEQEKADFDTTGGSPWLATVIKGNVTKTQNGMGLMFDSKQMTNLLQKEGKVTDKQAVTAVSTLAKSTDGARVGFEFTK